MAGGGGALGFGSGLAKGLAAGLLRREEQKREDQRRAEDADWKQAQMLEPIIRQQSLETGDWGGYHSFLEKYAPGLAKELTKNGPSAFESLGPILTQTAPNMGEATPPPGSTEPAPPMKVGGLPPDPNRPAWLFGGTPLLSQEQRQDRTQQREVALMQGQQDARYKSAIARGLSPEEAARYALTGQVSSTPPDAFGTLTPGAGVYNKKTGEITEPASAKDVAKTLTGALGERTRELQALHPEWDEPTARTEAAKSLVEERASDQLSKQANAESIQANRALQKTLLEMQANQGGITPNNAAALTTQLRRDWQKAIKPFQERQTYVGKLNEMITPDANGKTGIQRDRNVATQTIINSFNRLLEEQNTVREGEYARSEELTPLSTWLESRVTALQAGGGKLTDDQLKSIAKEGIRIAQVTADVYGEGLKDMRKAMTTQLGRYQLPSEDVFGSSKIGAEDFTATLDGKPYHFPTQAKLDAFKRQFPKAQ